MRVLLLSLLVGLAAGRILSEECSGYTPEDCRRLPGCKTCWDGRVDCYPADQTIYGECHGLERQSRTKPHVSASTPRQIPKIGGFTSRPLSVLTNKPVVPYFVAVLAVQSRLHMSPDPAFTKRVSFGSWGGITRTSALLQAWIFQYR